MLVQDILEFRLGKPPDKRITVSFSGGETSALMSILAKEYWSNSCDLSFVFANTGQENEETLDFVDKCDREFGLNVVWIEAIINQRHGVGTRYKIVDFNSAHRGGDLFDAAIRKYGIPNMSRPHSCTTVLKAEPIRAYSQDCYRKKKHSLAIGIRADEFDRQAESRDRRRIIYPLIDAGIQKPDVNRFWSRMPFRLNLKGWEGNCKTCWKKSDRKLGTVAKEHPEWFDCFEELESKYSNYRPPNQNRPLPSYFFRKNRTVADIKKIPLQDGFIPATDDSLNTTTIIQGELFDYGNEPDGGCSESCEAF